MKLFSFIIIVLVLALSFLLMTPSFAELTSTIRFLNNPPLAAFLAAVTIFLSVTFAGIFSSGNNSNQEGTIRLVKIDPIVAIGMGIDFLALIISGIAFWLALDANQIARSDYANAVEGLHDQKLATAWQMLSTPTIGDSGRAYALRELMKAEDGVRGLDMSCNFKNQAISDSVAEFMTYGIGYQCDNSVSVNGESFIGSDSVFDKFEIDRANLRGIESFYGSWTNVAFTDSDLSGSAFSTATLSGVSFTNVQWAYSDLSDVTLTNVVLEQVDLTGSDLSLINANDVNAYFPVNISGVVFCTIGDTKGGTLQCAEGLDQRFFSGAWYYAANPPIGLAEAFPDVHLIAPCDANAKFGWYFPPTCDEEKEISSTDIEKLPFPVMIYY